LTSWDKHLKRTSITSASFCSQLNKKACREEKLPRHLDRERVQLRISRHQELKGGGIHPL
jgi:hypothetical protein